MKLEEVEKLVATMHDKKRICYTDKIFKTSIKSRINIEKKFNQEAWLKPYIDLKTELKNDFRRKIFQVDE